MAFEVARQRPRTWKGAFFAFLDAIYASNENALLSAESYQQDNLCDRLRGTLAVKAALRQADIQDVEVGDAYWMGAEPSREGFLASLSSILTPNGWNQVYLPFLEGMRQEFLSRGISAAKASDERREMFSAAAVVDLFIGIVSSVAQAGDSLRSRPQLLRALG